MGKGERGGFSGEKVALFRLVGETERKSAGSSRGLCSASVRWPVRRFMGIRESLRYWSCRRRIAAIKRVFEFWRKQVF